MATNNNRTITWSQILKTLGAVGVIIAAIIAGVFSIITTNMQINANSNSSGPDFSPPGTSTSENPTEELESNKRPNTTPGSGTAETSTIESLSEDIISDETTNIQSSEESYNLIFTHKYGKIELTDSHSGVAYIYKSLLDEMPIGTITKSNQPSGGWQISLFKGIESFGIYLFSETHTPPIERCLVQYNVLGDCQIIFGDTPNYFYNASGDLQIEFSYNNIPFDLRESEAIDVDYVLS